MTLAPLLPKARILLDGCVSNPGDSGEWLASEALFELAKLNVLDLRITPSVEKELNRAPKQMRSRMEVDGVQWESARKPQKNDELRFRRVARILGNRGRTARHIGDVNNLIEAHRYRADYFVTTDKRILGRARKLEAIVGTKIVSPSTLLEIIHDEGGT